MVKRDLAKTEKQRRPKAVTERRVDATHVRELAAPAREAAAGWFSAAAIREVVESIAIAFMLAFLFRTFEAEAFVIPTGSMAPTLLGQHKEVQCPQCGYSFEVSASEEVDSETGAPTGLLVVAATCPLCRFPVDLRRGNPHGEPYRSYKGDRLIVVKFPYQFGAPQRWDVAVFKYPGGARTNFIKRIVGLPGETILIRNGDLFVKPAEEEDFFHRNPVDPQRYQILRKPPEKVRAMLQLVDDNDRLQPGWSKRGWPPRWAPENSSSGQWTPAEDWRSFTFEGRGQARLVYRHYVPTYDDWEQAIRGRTSGNLQRQLVSDFCGYNTEVTQNLRFAGQHGGVPLWATPTLLAGMSAFRPEPKQMGLHWVGDLAVEFELEVKDPTGSLAVELVEGGRTFRCLFDLATGSAEARIDALPHFRPRARTGVNKAGRYRIMWANVDDQLLLWINDRVISFDPPAEYPALGNDRPSEADLQPVVIQAEGTRVTVRHLKLYRDIFYIAVRGDPNSFGRQIICDFVSPIGEPLTAETVNRALSDWQIYAARKPQMVHFPLRHGQYLVLGDNSAESMDSRLWEDRKFEYYVREDLLIGKALFVFWPRSLDRIPGTRIPVWFFPNFWKMRFVR
ncbi:MAG: signal peptidase I [Thermoguttaceae bacterium]|nr:signal peptidase I [Thermoguttaceae bacterium]MDW8077534.1 signal peptidase I [Thermoguttaceae bacterium]